MMNKRKLVKFIRYYSREDNWHELDVKSGDLGYGWIHYGLLRLLKPKRVLVVGSKYGFVPAVCAMTCKANKKGKVDFVDAGYDQSANPQDKNHWGGVGFWKKVNVKKHFGKFGLDKYIKFYLMTSKEFKNKYKDRKYDYVYLDGDHFYRGVKSDFRMFWSRLRKNGYLALHDIDTEKLGGLDYGVNKLWQEIKKSKRYNQVEFPGQCGLGIIQKI